MTKDELIERLKEIPKEEPSPESAHYAADAALVEYINDPDVTAAYGAIEKWYA